MRSIFRFTALAAWALIAFSCAKTTYEGAWQGSAVQVDGHPDEWSLPLRFLDNDSRLNYSITNDAQNLYVCIQAADNSARAKALIGGMELWIDTTGGKKQLVGIKYPMPQADGQNEKRDEADRPDMSEIRRKFLSGLTDMDLQGFKNIPNGVTAVSGSKIKVAIGIDSLGKMTYEASIPFSAIYGNPRAVNDKVLSLGIRMNGLAFKHDAHSGMRQANGGSFSRGGALDGASSGAYGAMGSEETTYSAGSEQNDMSITNNMWIRLKLKGQ